MAERADTYTRWAVIASGEGGNRIASRMHVRDLPAVDDRVLLMNTARPDIRGTIDRVTEELPDGGETLEDHAIIFGSRQGAGNDFELGRRYAEEDFDTIVGGISDAALAEAFMHVTTLGGGTGSGSIPYVVERFKSGDLGQNHQLWMDDVVHMAMGIWPYYDEPSHRHFNAICGLSRLLRMPDGAQNADMVLLAANSQIVSNANRADKQDEMRDNRMVNEQLTTAFELMTEAGREMDGGVIDVQDYVQIPSQIGAYHFTPAVATGQKGSVINPEFMFDTAANNAFVPLDVGTTRVAYAVVRAPERLIGQREFTPSGVERAFMDWKRTHGLDGVQGMTTLTSKPDGRDEVDVLLLLGGFDLDPLLDHSRDGFDQHRRSLDAGSRLGETSLSASQLDRLESNLNEYLDRPEV